MEFKVPATGAEWRSAPRVCRCCLSEGCYKDISTEYYWMGEKETYAEMLKECFDLTISLQDAANSNGRLICEVCITRLRDATNFKKQVVRSEQRFAEHLQSGASLSTISVTEGGPYQEVKVEGVKDEMLVSDDDDVDDGPVDDDTLDPDYDESDSLPLKYEVQKKEALVELSFGDEIPTLSNTETTIRRVSAKGKDKSPAKKLKLNKKELTIKPVKASGSKVKAAKAPKAPKVPKAPKPAKPATKKGPKIRENWELQESDVADSTTKSKSHKTRLKKNVGVVLQQLSIDLTNPILPEELSLGESNMEVFVKDVTKNRSKKSHDFNTGKSKKRVGKSNIPVMLQLMDVDLADKTKNDIHRVKYNLMVVLENSTACPFKYQNTSSSYVCFYCDAKYSEFSQLRAHTSDNHPVSQQTFRKAKWVPTHTKVEISDLKCKLCSVSFPTVEAIRDHLIYIHGKDINNSHGDGTVSYKLDTDAFDCHICSMHFTRFRHLSNHLSVHYRNFVCDVCGAPFLDRCLLRQHVQTHNRGDTYPCPQCGVALPTQTKLRSHLSRVHQRAGYRLACPHCPERFKEYRPRVHHMKAVHNVQNLNCPCPACKPTADRPPTGEKRFECPECGKQFTRRSHLMAHQVVHTGVKAFKCEVCEKVYARKKTLTTHMMIHNNVRRYACSECGKTFIQKSTLNGHMRVHFRNT